ncbi:39S ribosomal protein L22, mitochondrial [Coemansia sp. RSA 552]|nr:39S ribosomal protein L22, mitochondrial [Coemansia sp. RSA 552]
MLTGLIRSATQRVASFGGTARRFIHAGRVASKEAEETPQQVGASPVFSSVEEETTSEQKYTKQIRNRYGEGIMTVKEATFGTANFSTSPRKLRLLGNQISGQPVTEAIRQLQVSPKKAARTIIKSLVFARDNAIVQKGMNPDKMFVKEAKVGKGRFGRKLEYKARSRFGIIRKPTAHMKFVLWEKQDGVVARNAAERALLAGSLPRRNIKGFRLTRKVWTPLNERKPVINPKGYYNW